MNKRKKGFTLVELLVTIVLLGVIGGIVIYNMTSVSTSSKQKEYERFVAAVKSAAGVYADNNSDVFNDLYVNKAYLYITTGDLITNGYLAEDLKNPYTEEKIGTDELIKANLDSTSGALTFEYPYEGSETEQFLVAINDYVIYGEPYDCMTGSNSYRLSLSDENGNLISVDPSTTEGKANIEKYHVTCTMPEGWSTYKDENGNQVELAGRSGEYYQHINQAGDYTINYSWLTSSGTKKTASRVITVLEQYTPDLDLRAVNVNSSEYSQSGQVANLSSAKFETGSSFTGESIVNTDGGSNTQTGAATLYTPTVSSDCSTWTVLAFKPSLSGADTTGATYTLTKSQNNDAGDYTNVATFTNNQNATNGQSPYTGAQSSDWDKVYMVDDGVTEYTLTTISKGHYMTSYTHKNTSTIQVKQDLVIPTCKISGGSTTYSAAKTINISDTYSPIGIYEYEYKLVESTADVNQKADPDNTSVFGRTGVVTSQVFNAKSSSNNTCGSSTTRYTKLYVRAVNKNGYKGKWVSGNDAVNVYLSNNISDLIPTNGGSDCNSACATTSNLSASYFVNTSLNNLSCYYCQKNVYLKWGNMNLNVLGKYSDNRVLVSTDQTITPARISLSTLRGGYWSVQTCDGTFSASFAYYAPAFETLTNYLAYLDTSYNNGVLPNNRATVLAQHTWHATVGRLNLGAMPSAGQWGHYYDGVSRDYASQWAAWARAYSYTDARYSGYLGVPSYNDFMMFASGQSNYGNGSLYANNTYWLGTTISPSSVYVQVSGHSDNTTVANTFFRVFTTGGVNSTYSASSEYVKAMMVVKNGIVCRGTGTASDPYIISEG